MRYAGILALALAVLAATALPFDQPAARAAVAAVAAADDAVEADNDADTNAVAADVGPPYSRLSGSNRYGSAVSISEWAYADPADATTVYLARGDNFSDALTAGTLSDGPVLLVRGGCGTVPDQVMAEIRRLDPGQVIALGGSAAVCDQALATAAQGRPTDRIGGANREATAALIAQRAFPDGAERVYLTRGAVNADAVVGGMLRDGPILLTSTDGQSVPEETAAAIAALAPGTVVALGGSAAVADATLESAAAGRPTGRLSGSNRYATAVAIAKYAYPSRTSRIYLARGDGTNFVDAVASGMLTDGPVLLTPGTCERVRSQTGSFLEQRDPSRIVALGGSAALCTSTLRGASLDARPDPDCSRVACVALTFDDGPSRYTPQLLDTLAAERVPATFFVVGTQVDAYPSYTRRAYVEGHPIANHSWNHTQLTTLTASGQRSQLERVETELAQHRIPRTDIMRPPYGSFNSTTRSLGYPIIIWDVDPRDWEGPSAATIRSRVVGGSREGSIVLQHDIHANSVAAVPAIIDDLHARGYTLVTVDELVPSMRDGDVVYRRDNITRSGQPASTGDTIVLPDGTELGPFVDESGIPGIAPQLTREEILEAAE